MNPVLPAYCVIQIVFPTIFHCAVLLCSAWIHGTVKNGAQNAAHAKSAPEPVSTVKHGQNGV